MASLDDERVKIYGDLVFGGLDQAARAALEALMLAGKYEYQSEFARRYYGEGRAEGEAQDRAEGEAQGRAEGEAQGRTAGKAEALLVLLAARSMAPSAGERDRILGERDPARLDAWIARAVTTASVTELLDERGGD